MRRLIAYHNNADDKTAILAELAAHRKAAALIQGHGRWRDGKGGAIGCTLHSSDDLDYELRFGIPFAIAALKDVIFERLAAKPARKWPERLMGAIEPGQDLSLVHWHLLHWLLTTEEINPGITHATVNDAVMQCADLMADLTAGRSVAVDAAQRAARAAWATTKVAKAARSARAATPAARAALRSAQSARSAANAAVATAIAVEHDGRMRRATAVMSAAQRANDMPAAMSAATAVSAAAWAAGQQVDIAAQATANAATSASMAVAAAESETRLTSVAGSAPAWALIANKLIDFITTAPNNAAA